MYDSRNDKRHDEEWLRLIEEATDNDEFDDEADVDLAEIEYVPEGYVPAAAPEWLGAWLWVQRQRAMGRLPN